MPARNTIEILIKAKDEATTQLQGIADRVETVGQRLTDVGGALTTVFAPMGLAIGASVQTAVNFDTAMTNVGTVLGRTGDEMAVISQRVQDMGTDSQFGATTTANAMYDIVSGVTDASTHFAILENSILTASAGASDLQATTNAMIDTMNSYGYAAEDAGYASDVLTRTVGMGKGTMDEFAAALPGVTGLASSLGIEFGDVGAAAAFLTTKGATAATAVTQLSAMMTAVLNPNETMKKGLRELGFESGESAIQTLGLAGAYLALQGTQIAADNGMAKMVGSVEALRGATTLADEGFATFSDTFISGIDGATAAAAELQGAGIGVQMKELRSQMEGLGITVGEILLPPLRDLITDLGPLLLGVRDWVKQNPEVARTLLLVVGAMAVAGPVLWTIGTVVTALTTIWGGLTAALGLLKIGTILLTGAKVALGVVMGAVGTASTLASVGLAATGTAAFGAIAGLGAMLAPVLALLAGLAALAAAAAKVLGFMADIRAQAAEAGAALDAANLAGAGITEDQVYDQAFASAAYGFGGGVFGDVMARLTYTNFAGEVLANSTSVDGRASGGPVRAGTPYIVGERQPELFVPETNGRIIPSLSGLGNQYHVTLNVPAEIATNPAAMGNAQRFADAVGQMLAMRGG